MNDNKLIAEFMVSVDGYWSKDDNQGNGEQLYFHPHDTEHQQMKPSEMLFETSWDWLIPVIEKTLDLTFDENGEPSDFYDLRDCIPDIHHTYRAVVQFINQHNIRCTVKN